MNRSLRITVNTLSVTAENEGIRTQLTGLLPALVRVGTRHTFRLICTRANVNLFAGLGDIVDWVVLPIPPRGPVARIWHDQFTVARLVRRETDVLFTPSSVGTILSPVPQVVAVQAHLALPSLRRDIPEARLSAAHRLYYGPVMRLSHRRAALITPISDYLAQGLVSETGVPAGRVTSILSGVDPVTNGLGTSTAPNDYALFVGTLYPYKNAGLVIDALAHARDQLPSGFRLIVVGRDPDGRQIPSLAARARVAGVEERISLLGKVDADTLERLYRGATVLVLPSRAEGFGLPILEAMVRGIPVIAANRTALPEVVGEAGVLVDPDRPEDLAARLVALVRDPTYREQLRKAGRERAAELSWDNAAAAYVRAFERVAAEAL